MALISSSDNPLGYAVWFAAVPFVCPSTYYY